MSNISKRKKESSKSRFKAMGDHDEFLFRITKSLYYGELPSIPCLSLPVTELSAELFSESQKGKTLKRLHVDNAAELTRNACVSPCSLVLALLYLERLKTGNPEYVAKMAPSELFLVSLMVSNKFLQDDGEDDEVFSDEWAASAGISTDALNLIERNFLHAIDWRVFVSENSFDTALEWLEHQVALRQAKLRGWFTYADLANITNTIEGVGLMKCLMTVYMALSVSYIASISTLIASSFIVSQGLLTLSTNREIANIILGPHSYYHFQSNGNDSSLNDTDNYLEDTETLLGEILDQPALYSSTELDQLTRNDFKNMESNRNVPVSNRIDNEQYYSNNNWLWFYTDIFQWFLHSSLKNEHLNCSSKFSKRYLEYCEQTDKNKMTDVFPSESHYQLNKEKKEYSIMWQYSQAYSVSC